MRNAPATARQRLIESRSLDQREDVDERIARAERDINDCGALIEFVDGLYDGWPDTIPSSLRARARTFEDGSGHIFIVRAGDWQASFWAGDVDEKPFILGLCFTYRQGQTFGRLTEIAKGPFDV